MTPATLWDVEFALLVILCTSNVHRVQSFSTRGGRKGEDLYCKGPFEPNVLIRCYRALMSLDSVYLVKDESGLVVAKCHFTYPYAVKRPREFGFVVKKKGTYEVSTDLSHGIFHQKIQIVVGEAAQRCNFQRRESAGETLYSIENCRFVDVVWEVYREFPFRWNRRQCINPDFMGKVDVVGYLALRSFRPADVFYSVKYFSIDLKKMPVGWLEIRAKLTSGKTYAAIEFVKVASEPVFVTDISPYADNLPWSARRSFVMSTDILVVPFSDKSGFTGRIDRLLRYTWSCAGPSIICSEVDRIVVKSISVSGRILRKCINKAFTIKFRLELMGPWKLYLNVIKRVKVMDGSWPIIELLCIRNCQKNRLFTSVSQRLAMYCHRCEETRYRVMTSWPQCNTYDGRCRHYMYYENWYNPDTPADTFNLIVKRGDAHHTFSFSYMFDAIRETGKMSPSFIFYPYDMSSRYILSPTVDLNHTGEHFEMAEFSLLWPFELVGRKRLPLFSSFQSVVKVPISIEDDIGAYMVEIPKIQIRLCARGHCYDEQASIELPKTHLVKNKIRVSMGMFVDRMAETTQFIAPLWMAMYILGLKNDYLWRFMRTTKEKTTARMTRLVKDKITYAQTEVALITVLAALPMLNKTLKNDLVKDPLIIVETVVDYISTCTTDIPLATFEKNCMVAKTLTKLLNWMEPQRTEVSNSHKVGQFASTFLRILRKLANHTMATYDHKMQHCVGAGWQLMWQKLVLVDSDVDGYYMPEAFRLPQRMSDLLVVRFQRRALYWKVRSQPKMRDYMVHMTIYHATKVLFPKPWVTHGMKYEDAGTTVIDMFQESSGASILTTQSSGALQIEFTRGDSMRSSHDDGETSSVGLTSDYLVKDGELVATCHWIVIATTTEVLRTLTIDFHSNKQGTNFSVKFMKAKNSEAFVGFHDLAETDFTEKQSVHILDKVTKSFNYDNPEAQHVFRLSVSHVKDLEYMVDSKQTFYISITLSQARCSYLDEVTQEWDTDVCKITNKTDTTILCECKRSSGVFSADIIRINEQLNMVNVKQYLKGMALVIINEEILNPQLVMLITLWIIYITMMAVSLTSDKEYSGMYRTYIAEYHFNPEDRFQYMICIKTSALPHAGTTSRAWITLIGKLRTTADMLLDNKCGFERGSECWFITSTAFYLGDIMGVFVRLDNVVVDDNWRINEVEVYDCQRDILVRFPNYNWMSQHKTTQLCPSDQGRRSSLTIQIFSKFGEMLRDYHQLLCFFLNVPGCRRMVYQVTRLHCSILWCNVFTHLFMTGVPAYRFKESKVTFVLRDMFITVPVVMILNFLFIRLRMLLVPNFNWGMAKPQSLVPPARVVDRLRHHKRTNSKRFRLRAKIIQAMKKKEEAKKTKGKYECRRITLSLPEMPFNVTSYDPFSTKRNKICTQHPFKARAQMIAKLNSSLKSSMNQRAKLKEPEANQQDIQNVSKSRASGFFWPFGRFTVAARKDSIKEVDEGEPEGQRASLIKGRKSHIPDQNNSYNEAEYHRGGQNNSSNSEPGGQNRGQYNNNEHGGQNRSNNKPGGRVGCQNNNSNDKSGGHRGGQNNNSNNKPGGHRRDQNNNSNDKPGGRRRGQNSNSNADHRRGGGKSISAHSKPTRSRSHSFTGANSSKILQSRQSFYADMIDTLGLRHAFERKSMARQLITSSVDETITGPPGGGVLGGGGASGQTLRAIRPRIAGMWIVDRISRIDMSAKQNMTMSTSAPQLNDIFKANKKNIPFAVSPIGAMLQDPHWKDDPMTSRIPYFGKGIYSYSTSRLKEGVDLGDTHRYKYNEESGDRNEDRKQLQRKSFQILIGKNVMTAIISLNLALCSIYMARNSMYLRDDKMIFSIVYSMFVFVSIVFIIEPSFLLIITIFHVFWERASPARQSARKRFKDATIVLRRWYEIQEKNYSFRFRYFPANLYSSIGGIRHSNFINRLERKKNSRIEKVTERRFKGSLSLPVFLLCVIVIMNVHGNIQSSFRQKDMIYKSLDFTDEVEHKAPDTNEMWQFLNEKYLRFFHALDNTLSVKKTRIFSKMRQIRVKPAHNNCSAPRIPIFQVPEIVCHVMLDERTVDTQNYSRDWQSVYTDPKKAAASREKLFLYTHATVGSLLEYIGTVYPLGGYTYIFSASYGDNAETLRKMEYSKWVDENTRALIIETSVYDFNTGVATALVITYHFQGDGIKLTYENQSFAFSFRTTSIIILLIAFNVLATLTLVELSTQYSKAISFGVLNYMRDAENIMTIISLTFYVFILIGFVFRYQLSYIKYSTLSRTIYGTDGSLFLNMRDLGFMVFFLNGFSGFLAFTALMTILQSAKNIPKLYIMLMMIRNVFILSTFPAIVIIMMAMSSHLAFQTTSFEMSTFKNAVYSVMQFVLDPQGLNIGSPGVSNAFTVFQWTAFFVIITNGFVVTLNEDYSVLVMETKKAGSKSILASLTEMALASVGVINLEDTTSSRGRTLELKEKQKRQADESQLDDKMFIDMGHGW